MPSRARRHEIHHSSIGEPTVLDKALRSVPHRETRGSSTQANRDKAIEDKGQPGELQRLPWIKVSVRPVQAPKRRRGRFEAADHMMQTVQTRDIADLFIFFLRPTGSRCN